ncbi:endonuclease/exonuclease/phosphatase family protein [Yoonia litorea]|uniref:Metal-dependent hydrolase, endonuclease/exonuclease/phosphatase family n=1 Tax=Yoonia litorea TaxID=1123755 RepID=A0A1I6N1S4_9RHOB|nr:endonuclease/exonuclease/phosphatase family protein [Yoonia litorea]SFS21864.1 Metal-dependent hydrolase, endonuclease/exonuclease/phosphatase family [Yoonia litorea]
MRQAHKPRDLRIASYNIRKTKGLDGKRNPGQVIDVLNALEADVVALQEADHRLGARPAALPYQMITSGTDFDVVPLAANDVSLGWHGNAILVRRGLDVSQPRRLRLPGLEPRGAVAVTLNGKTTIVGVHLGLMRHSRRQQLSAIMSQIGDPAQTVMIGDMNEWANTRGFEPLDGHLTVHSPGRSFHAARPIAALDRIAIGVNVALMDAGVDESPRASRVSDHLPIWADVSVAAG